AVARRLAVVGLALRPADAGLLPRLGVLQQDAEVGRVELPEVDEVADRPAHAGTAESDAACALACATWHAASSFSIASRASSRLRLSGGSRRTQLSPPPAISRCWSRASCMNSRFGVPSLTPIRSPLPRTSSTTSG